MLAWSEVTSVLAIKESSAALVDEIAARLKLSANSTEHSAARRDKSRMQETIAAAGLRAIKSFVAVTADDALARIRQKQRYPVVVKPLRGFGSKGVLICDNEQEVTAAFDALLGSTMLESLGEGPLESLLVQEYLVGQEFVVNWVSRAGRAVVSDMWLSFKPRVPGAAGPIYRKQTLVPSSSAHPEIIDYSFEVLRALGIRHGHSHFELILTADGPCPVEIGARPSGGSSRPTDALQRSAHDIPAMACTDQPDQFMAVPTHYVATHHMTCLWLVAPTDSFIFMPTADKIAALSSFHRFDSGRLPFEGRRLFMRKRKQRKLALAPPTVEGRDPRCRVAVAVKTTVLHTQPTSCVLMSDDAAQVEADCAAIIELEMSELYQKPPEPCVMHWLGIEKPAEMLTALNCEVWTCGHMA